MTKQHECKWIPDFYGEDRIHIGAKCECGEALNTDQVKSRLNDYEPLKAEFAELDDAHNVTKLVLHELESEYETLKKATDALGAEDAREYSPCIRRDCIAPPCECADALLAYANILEGK